MITITHRNNHRHFLVTLSGRLVPMLGDTPEERSQSYSLFSPVTHAHVHCPPTLILHGEQDILAPVKAIQRLHSRLTEVGVPVAIHVLPQTDHAFDLILPKISPSAHNAIYDVERFLNAHYSQNFFILFITPELNTFLHLCF